MPTPTSVVGDGPASTPAGLEAEIRRTRTGWILRTHAERAPQRDALDHELDALAKDTDPDEQASLELDIYDVAKPTDPGPTGGSLLDRPKYRLKGRD